MTGVLMPRKIQIEWAKEIVLDGIDEEICRQKHLEDFALDDEMELVKQRNRVARFLGLPTREMRDF